MFLIAAAIVLLCSSRLQNLTLNLLTDWTPALLLAGCSSTSPAIPNIFLISFYYQHYPPTFSTAQVDPGVSTAISNIVGQADLNVRVGYFGICIREGGGAWMCNQNASALADLVSVDQDPLNLIWVAKTFKDYIVFPYLM